MQTALAKRLESDTTLAAALVSGGKARIHWTKVPQDSGLPYIRMQTISDPRPEHLGGYQGARQTRVQVDVFSSSYGQARALAEAVIAAVAESDEVGGIAFGRTKAEGPRDLGEDVSGVGFVHRLSLDLLTEHRLA
ncbi:tail completion protein gp17 [Qipengyuania proteolytica]|uniref:tail completion protein gp17 n=1 Tax=Qipengyuania proteolytica TaxID=2867239 RepID=UPI001FFCE5D9|nr:DUF3168 domain-containing protein [Qipengyuania proteolytica]